MERRRATPASFGSITAAVKQATAEDTKAREGRPTVDSFQNFAAKLGLGADNVNSQSTYGFNPITRNHVLLEWIHRGTWLGGMAVDIPADDMTRAGIEITEGMDGVDASKLTRAMTSLGIWPQVNSALCWDRLYGGAISVMLIDGQDMRTPLRVDSIGKGQFKGLATLDRWQVEPQLNELVTDFGPDMGKPKYYRVLGSAHLLQGQVIHHSRCFRFDGVRTPYWQRLTENLWGISVIERIYDRMLAFDSATTGASQLVYKAHLRSLKIEGLRELISLGGSALEGLVAQMQFTAQYQTSEGMMLVDGADEYSEHGSATTFSGLADILNQFGQQLAGALRIPLVRMFGLSPGGLGSSGESEMRTYYDGVNQDQELKLRHPIDILMAVMSRSVLGTTISDDVVTDFRSLYELNDTEKATVAAQTSTAVSEVFNDGIIDRATALKELRNTSKRTGIFSTIEEAQITEAEQEPPPLPEAPAPGDEQNLPGGGAPPSNPPGNAGAAPSPVGGQKPPKQPPSKLPAKDTATGESLDPQRSADLLRLRRYGGLDMVIETPKDSYRSGTTADGKGWTVRMPADYGFIHRTVGADGDGVDCFMGPDLRNIGTAWIIDQRDTETGKFDEHKVMIGFPTRAEALHAYCASFSDSKGADRIGAVSENSVEYLRAWLRTADLSKPASGFFKTSSKGSKE